MSEMSHEADRPEYSIVVPIYNEEETVSELVRRLQLLLEQLDGPAEMILVDDGSSDRSHELMLAAHGADSRIKVLRLSRNFGHQIAITAGMDLATGNAVIIMDADLQDPPEVVLEMTARWREGFDVIYGVREERPGDSPFKRATAAAFYRLFRRLSETDVPLDAGDFRLVDRRALEGFKAMRETNRYVRGMFGWIGFHQVGVRFQRAERFAGDTKYPLTKMLKFATDGIVSFSTAPLRFALKLGFLVAGLSFIFGFVALVSKLAGLYSIPGLASIAVFVSFLGGIQLVVLGLMGEYIARIHDEVKGRPLYLVRDAHGLAPLTESAPRSRERLERP
jgi:glycosyltransferase involved in cell wall biosynthesis